MNKLLLTFALAFATCIATHAQAPKGINYQGVARDNEGKPIISMSISVRISILKGAANGEVEYSETHKPQTNQFGLFTLVIGQGTAGTGSFAFVSWAVGNKWLQIEIDPSGGSSFQLAGSQQLMSVPYAFYSEYSGNSSGLTAGQGIAINNGVISNAGDGDTNPTNELITSAILTADKKLRITDAGGTKEVDFNSIANTDNQSLSLTGTNLAITGGNSVNLASVITDGQNLSLNSAGTNRTINITNGASVTLDVADNDNNSTNEIQSLTKAGAVVTLSNGGGAITLNDDNATNEIQTLTKTGATISLNNGGGSVVLNDDNATNEIQDLALNTGTNTLSLTNDATPVDLTPYKQSLSLTGTTLAISGGNTVNLAPVNSDSQNLSLGSSLGTTRTINITNGTSVTLDVADADNDPTNELQDLSIIGNNLSITNKTGAAIINLAPYLDNTDSQNLTIGTSTGTNRSINISNGTGVIIDVADNDNNSTNEIQALTKAGAVVSLSNGGGTITLNDDNATNEIQALTKTGTTISLSNGGGSVTLNDDNATNEIQALTKTGATITLSNGGGTVVLNDDNATNEIQNLTQVLTVSPNAGGIRIQNMGDPSLNSDATTKGYVDTAIATAVSTTYAFKTTYAFINPGGSFTDSPILLTENFDDFNVVSSNRFTATAAGIYSFSVTGTSPIGNATIKLKVTSGSTSFFEIKKQQSYPDASIRNYQDSNIYKLNAGDTVELVVTSLIAGERVDGILFGYKL